MPSPSVSTDSLTSNGNASSVSGIESPSSSRSALLPTPSPSVSTDSAASNGKASEPSSTPSLSSSGSALLPIPSPSVSTDSLASNGNASAARLQHRPYLSHRGQRCYQSIAVRVNRLGSIQTGNASSSSGTESPSSSASALLPMPSGLCRRIHHPAGKRRAHLQHHRCHHLGQRCRQPV